MKLKEALARKKFVVTSEVQAPVEDEPERPDRTSGTGTGTCRRRCPCRNWRSRGLSVTALKTCELLQAEPIRVHLPDHHPGQKPPSTAEGPPSGPQTRGGKPAGLHRGLPDHRGQSAGDDVFPRGFGQAAIGAGTHAARDRRSTDRISRPRRSLCWAPGWSPRWGKNVPDLEMKEMEEMTRIGTGYFLTTPVFDRGPLRKIHETGKHLRRAGDCRGDDPEDGRHGPVSESPPQIRHGARVDDSETGDVRRKSRKPASRSSPTSSRASRRCARACTSSPSAAKRS